MLAPVLSFYQFRSGRGDMGKETVEVCGHLYPAEAQYLPQREGGRGPRMCSLPWLGERGHSKPYAETRCLSHGTPAVIIGTRDLLCSEVILSSGMPPQASGAPCKVFSWWLQSDYQPLSRFHSPGN